MGVPLRSLDVTDFLAWESQQLERHEFVRGEVFAMVGGTRGHHRIVANLVRHLGNHLEGSPCQVFGEAMKVQVADEAILYPGVVVTCDRQFRADDPALHEPVVVVDVLSPSTQRYDRSEKFALYRKLPSLREYVLIDPETRRIEVFRPGADGTCAYLDQTDGAELAIESLDSSLSAEAVFRGLAAG